MNCSDSDSENKDSTPRSGRSGPQIDKHGKTKARNKSAGVSLRSRVLVVGGQAFLCPCLAGQTTTGRHRGVAPTVPLKIRRKDNLLRTLQALQKPLRPVQASSILTRIKPITIFLHVLLKDDFVHVAVVLLGARRRPYEFDQHKKPNWASRRHL